MNPSASETRESARVTDAELQNLCRLVRRHVIRMTTKAGSGHVTSSFSATELMTALFFDALRYDPGQPHHPNNDRVVFSKGHASPLLFALYAAAGVIPEKELDTLRTLGSRLEGHPTPNFEHVDAATGSLGQGLSVGLGLALNARHLDRLPYRTWVLLGDSEVTEGQVWEAIQLAPHYDLGNLIAIVDVNRLGQRGPTMLEHRLIEYHRRFEAFGWNVRVVEGHDLGAVRAAYDAIDSASDTPTAILAKTYKGRGVSFLEDKDGWHGKALSEEQAKRGYEEIGAVKGEPVGRFRAPEDLRPETRKAGKAEAFTYEKGEKIATRKAYGQAIARVGKANPAIVALDGEVSNSTYAEIFAEAIPDRFFEMYIAEQNMVSAAVGLSARGKIPFVSSFAAFLTRAADQIRMAVYSKANVKFVGSHAGVSIGEDGPSQMALEDLALFRTLGDSVVLYPSDAVSTEKLVEAMAEHRGIAFLRTTRPGTPVLYGAGDEFPIGGSRTVREGDAVTVVGAGITLHLALEAAERLAGEGISLRVVDAYSVKPLDVEGLRSAAAATGGRLLVVEDHWPEGGLGEAVAAAFSDDPTVRVRRLAVQRIPGSAPQEETLRDAGIDAEAIARAARDLGGEA